MLICIKINSYARNIKETENVNKRQKILIVDDAKFNRDILKEFLGETYDYMEAENGNQAAQIMEENLGIDLMLLDINMPQMDVQQSKTKLLQSDSDGYSDADYERR